MKSNIRTGQEYRTYGYNDEEFFIAKGTAWNMKKWMGLLLALAFLAAVWLALDQKLLLGKAWISETYDNDEWRTNEGNLHTYGAWDFEAHVWKTEYIIKNFPNYNWNPYWYLGMPLLKYYQSGFYMLNWLVVALTGLSAARSSLLLIIFSHLLATLITFIVCYKVSKRLWVSALCSTFVLSNTFISLRSYGWEPITVVFLFLYPLGLLLFLKEPLRPFRFWLVLVLGLSYISHPLLWFSLCMTMGIYLFSVAVRQKVEKNALTSHYLLQLFGVVICSLLIGGIQFLPQITYQQATSGAHMGVKYLPYYQVPPNIISLIDFFFDAGNLKGPGPIIMISFFLLLIFAARHYLMKKAPAKKLHQHELISGLALVLVTMVLFYYMELYNIFPMNFLRSIQYHRIIPEFVIAGAVLVAAFYNLAYTYKQKVVYYSLLATFVVASGIIVYSVQAHWATVDSISSKPEFVYDKFDGRISFPYTDQSFAVRNSFTMIPQTYGYYEQGITNPYNDEIFSVSSGFHNADLTTLYLKAANVARLYVNMEEGDRDSITRNRLNGTLEFVNVNGSRYSYFKVPLANPSLVQAIDGTEAKKVLELKPQCRIMFKEKYCGSVGEEFVSTDKEEISYLTAYVKLLEKKYGASAEMQMQDPNHYLISVNNAMPSTAVVVKMSYDKDFSAKVDGKKVPVTAFGPDFMMIAPQKEGSYQIELSYGLGIPFLAGMGISAASLVALIFYFTRRSIILRSASSRHTSSSFYLYFKKGDMK